MPPEDAFLPKVIKELKRMPYWQIALLSCLVLALAISTFFLLRQPGRAGVVVAKEAMGDASESEPVTIKVYVAGAVLHPGVYEMEEGARVGDALQMAGGATAEAELSGLNLASRLRDGEKVAVTRIGEPVPLPGGSSPDAQRPVNLNMATATELDQVPGIGPVLAERIIDYRDSHGGFRDIKELRQVEGIGPKKFEDLKDKVEI